MMTRQDLSGDFGFLISIKKMAKEPESVPIRQGQAAFYRPKCRGYTSDWSLAGLYAKDYALTEVSRAGHSCEYVPVSKEFAKYVLIANKNPIETRSDGEVRDERFD